MKTAIIAKCADGLYLKGPFGYSARLDLLRP
jgi:hypothetical protein